MSLKRQLPFALALLALLALVLSTSSAAELPGSEWWRTASVYQIYPLSFKDSNGDGYGDLNGISSKLEHLVEAGVDAVWLSPIYTSPMVDFGYDIANFTNVDPIFGNLEDFDRLVAKAKSLGLRVILDFVPNHSSHKHEWFSKSIARVNPYDEYYVWKDAKIVNGTRQPPNNWLSTFRGSAWEWNEERAQYYLHQFAVGQPDLNYRSAALDQEMKNALSFWLERGVDGFRIDAMNHMFENTQFPDEPRSNATGIPTDDYDYLEHIYTKNQNETYDVLRSWRQLLDEFSATTKSDSKMILVEAYTSLDLSMKFYEYGANAPFNFMFVSDVNNRSRTADVVRGIELWLNNTPAGQVANWVVGNHDNHRVDSRLGSLKATQVIVLSSVLPGIAVFYNGDEIGMLDSWLSYQQTVDPAGCNQGPDRYELTSRDPERSPYQWDSSVSAGFSSSNRTWLPVNANYKTLNLAAQKTERLSRFALFQALGALRKTALLKNGTLDLIALPHEILAVVRQLEEQVMVTLFSFAPNQVVVDAATPLGLPKRMALYAGTGDLAPRAGSLLDTTKITLDPGASLLLTPPDYL